jgi:aminoglycoside phosphotransferase (APT) family kinase protein
MAPSVVVPASLLAQLRANDLVGPLSEIAATFGGFSNLTFFATTGLGERVVVKAATSEDKRADVRRERMLIEHLSDSDLPIPSIFAISEQEWTATVFRRVEGTSGLHVVQSRDIDDLCARGTLLARTLRRVHQTPPPLVDSGGFDVAARYASLVSRVQSLPISLVDADRSLQFVDALQSPILQRGVALVHGDAGLHNTIWDDASGRVQLSALIDWEWGGWGNPLGDLAWLWWTMRFRHLPSEVFEAVVETYGRVALVALGWSEQNVRNVVRAHMVSILLRNDPHTAGFEEWLTREAKLDSLIVPEFNR